MNIRPLTDTEKELIRKAKRKANKVLQARRKEITKQIEKEKRINHRHIGAAIQALEQKRDAIQLIAGSPVLVSANGLSMCLNYELLRKLNTSLSPRYWNRSLRLRTVPTLGPILLIEYERIHGGGNGRIELYELPEYQRSLLDGLPTVEVG